MFHSACNASLLTLDKRTVSFTNRSAETQFLPIGSSNGVKRLAGISDSVGIFQS